ncbi:MAG: Gfo/Idh/MocA family protein, partial [Stackebrandtia sp.]
MPVTEDTIEAPGYRAAIVGTGFMGRVHAGAVRVSGGRVVGVVGSSADRAKAAAKTLGAERVFADAEEALDSDEVDVVHVCTPNHLHGPIAQAALEAGKHVVCEKPLATDAATAQRLTDSAADRDRIATVPFVYRFHPMVREARELVRAGRLGSITLAHGGYLQDWLLHPEDDNWRVDPGQG